MLRLAVISVIFGLSVAYGGSYGDYHSIDLPIKSYHRGLKVIPVPSHVQKHMTEVKIPAGVMPVHMTFLSKTSPVFVDQKHKSTKGSYKKTKSNDEPHKLVHEVVKPVYQEITEIIKPYRKVIQVIEPVKEERLTKVYKGEHKEYYDNNGGEKKFLGALQNLDIDEEYLQ